MMLQTVTEEQLVHTVPKLQFYRPLKISSESTNYHYTRLRKRDRTYPIKVLVVVVLTLLILSVESILAQCNILLFFSLRTMLQ